MGKQVTSEGKLAEETIPVGKIKCFITGKFRNDTLEERVRQEVARSLVEEYRYRKEDIDIDFPIRIGRRLKRVDIIVFQEGRAHKQENAYMIENDTIKKLENKIEELAR
ncbi:MAG: hypothetical protein C4312_08090 [Thermoflexus sp.]